MASKQGRWWLAGLLLMSGFALAQRGYLGIEQRLSPEQLQEIGLTPAQLVLLDRYLREADAVAPVGDLGRDDAPAAGGERASRVLVGMDAERTATRAKGLVRGWAPGTVFTLENGQQWQVLKGDMKLRTPLQDPAVVLVPGVAGRWFLQVDEDMPKARVYRID